MSRKDDERMSMKGSKLTWLTFKEAQMQGADLSKCRFIACSLEKANLSEADLSNGSFFACDFSDSNLSKANFSNTDLSNARITKANMEDSDLSNSVLVNTDLVQTNLSGASFLNANMWSANLRGSNLTNANFKNAVLLYTDFSDTNITGADFTDAEIEINDFEIQKWLGPENLKKVRICSHMHNDYRKLDFKFQSERYCEIITETPIDAIPVSEFINLKHRLLINTEVIREGEL